MNTAQLDSHKKVLGILYIMSGAFTVLGALLINVVLSFVLTFAFDQADAEEQKIIDFVMAIAGYLPAFIIFVFAVPTLIAGFALLTRQSWAIIIALIVGCLKLFSFPIGTAMGIYAIWIFSEDQKISRTAS